VGLEIANLVVAAALVGLIWTVQVVVYPAFALVGTDEWARYGAAHRRRITWVVAPLMLANVGLAAALLLDDGPDALRVLNAALAGGVFAATGLIFAPMHGRLEETASPGAFARLVHGNWARTLAWTAQVAVAVALL
jgi:hypothetical protein